MRTLPETIEPSATTENVHAPPPQRKFVWIGEILRATRRVARKVWEIGTYGIPVRMGIASGMIWNRRDVLFAPVAFTMLFLRVTWGSGRPESMRDFANQLRENAKRLSYGISATLQTLYQGWDIIRVMFALAALIGLYWEISKWLLALRLKTDETRRGDARGEPVANTRPTPAVEPVILEPTAASTPTSIGTGVAVAAHPSTGAPMPVPEGSAEIQEEEEEDDSPRQRCQAAGLTITGCDRQNLAGLPCRETSLGKYFLLGDDALSKREDIRSAFFCAQHGKEYITIIKNKRRSHASCCQRGSLWERDGNWALECQYHMQLHFEEPKRKEENEESGRRKTSEQEKWEKTPESVGGPISSSGTSSADTASSKEMGMVVAAFPLWTKW